MRYLKLFLRAVWFLLGIILGLWIMFVLIFGFYSYFISY